MLGSIWVMLANWASMVAASSAVMVVAVASWLMVVEKSNRLSFLIPSCPATSITLASSVVVTGISVDSFITAEDMLSSSETDMSVVFDTPVIALSNSMDALAHSFSTSKAALSAFTIPVVWRAAEIPPSRSPVFPAEFRASRRPRRLSIC